MATSLFEYLFRIIFVDTFLLTKWNILLNFAYFCVEVGIYLEIIKDMTDATADSKKV